MSLSGEKKPTLFLVDDDAIIADSLEYVLSEEYQIERACDSTHRRTPDELPIIE